MSREAGTVPASRSPRPADERGRRARRIALWAVGGWLLVCCASLTTLAREERVLSDEARLAQQDAALGSGIYDPAPAGPSSLFRPASPRADLASALYLGRSVGALQGSARATVLAGAAQAADRAAAARPHWGEARTVQAFIAAQRQSPIAQQTLDLFARSYVDAPYLRRAAAWRVRFGLENWTSLPAEVQDRVIDEGVWLTRIDPQARDGIFAMARSSTAFLRFLLRWRTFRARDADADAGANRRAP